MKNQIKKTGIEKTFHVGEIIVKIENIGENKVLIFNNVAAHIWKLLEESKPIDVETIVTSINETYDVDFDMAKRDVRIFIESLLFLKMIEDIDLEFSNLRRSEPKVERIPYRSPKIYIYDLEKDEETAFGPHIRGRSYVHRAITKSWHGGCC